MPRPCEYDRETVVEQATALFWEQGYGKTSIGDLVDATGLQPGSLYAAFGNKKGLFLAVIEHYNQAFIAKIRALREEPGAAIELRGDAQGDGAGVLRHRGRTLPYVDLRRFFKRPLPPAGAARRRVAATRSAIASRTKPPITVGLACLLMSLLPRFRRG